MHLQFVESESTFAYFHATRAYLEAWGKPVAFYSDKHGVFRVNPPGARRRRHDPVRPRAARAQHRHHLRQFAPGQRAGSSARTRPCRTGWSRRLRLARHRTLADGNALLPAFMADYNARFAKPPANGRTCTGRCAGDDLDDAFAWKEERTLSRALTLQYDKVIFILEPSETTSGDRQAGHRRRLSRWPAVDPLQRRRAGLPHLRQAAPGLAGRDRREQTARRGSRLHCRKQKELDTSRSASAPRRRGQRNHMFKVG